MTDRFTEWLKGLHADVYAEPISTGHATITRKMAERVSKLVPAGGIVADIGCGQGPALEWFTSHGFQAIGTSLCDGDIEICRAKGFDVVKCDMHSGLDMFPTIFDLVWARHVLEHSVVPYWVLKEFHRMLKPGGILYAEMPQPDGPFGHETHNGNHYSVLGWNAWSTLIQRAGFDIIESVEMKVPTTPPDVYFGFVCKR